MIRNDTYRGVYEAKSDSMGLTLQLTNDLRARIHEAMSGLGAFQCSTSGEFYLSQPVGLRGLLIARMSEDSGSIAFGVRLQYAGVGVHVVQAVLIFDQNDFWVGSDIRANLNGRINLTNPDHDLFESTLSFIRTLNLPGKLF